VSDQRYIGGVTSLEYDAERCTGCRQCATVCPHGVFEMNGKRAVLADRDGCMECGACALNCQGDAIELSPGVGCAAAIINGWLTGTEPSCGC
jgi:NAD-dependent dihydropyrimidine dehydrogenase PreA subunit